MIRQILMAVLLSYPIPPNEIPPPPGLPSAPLSVSSTAEMTVAPVSDRQVLDEIRQVRAEVQQLRVEIQKYNDAVMRALHGDASNVEYPGIVGRLSRVESYQELHWWATSGLASFIGAFIVTVASKAAIKRFRLNNQNNRRTKR